ncbi:MAG: hypothetical protein AB8B85_05930, partial [Paracoccaceae bacterium]
MPRDCQVEGPGNLGQARLGDGFPHDRLARRAECRERHARAHDGAIGETCSGVPGRTASAAIELVQRHLHLPGGPLALDMGAQIIAP